MTKLFAYHNDPLIKLKYQERFAEHRKIDAVIQGQGYEEGRGCFVGCTLQSYDHSRFPTELGWPEWLAHLADRIFEGLPKDQAPQFGTDLLDAVAIGVNLEPVRTQFLIVVQRRNLERLKDNTEPYADQCRQAIQGVIDFLETETETETRSVESAAESALAAAESAR